MTRPITLFTGQWADLPLEEVARLASEWGYDGLEIACWGDHLDPWRAAEELKMTARAARRLGVDTVVGFTGSSIWKYVAMFPPATQDMVDAGYQLSLIHI